MEMLINIAIIIILVSALIGFMVFRMNYMKNKVIKYLENSQSDYLIESITWDPFALFSPGNNNTTFDVVLVSRKTKSPKVLKVLTSFFGDIYFKE